MNEKRKRKYFSLVLAAGVVLLAGFITRGFLERALHPPGNSPGVPTPGIAPEAEPSDWPVLGIGAQFGLAVTHVEPGSPAKHAGLRTGDFIKTLNGSRIADREALEELVIETTLDPVSLDVARLVEGGEGRSSLSVQRRKDGTVSRDAVEAPQIEGGAIADSDLGFSGVYSMWVIGASRRGEPYFPEGMQLGDIWYRLDDTSIDHNRASQNLIRGAPVGTEFNVHYLRYDAEASAWTVLATAIKSVPRSEFIGRR